MQQRIESTDDIVDIERFFGLFSGDRIKIDVDREVLGYKEGIGRNGKTTELPVLGDYVVFIEIQNDYD